MNMKHLNTETIAAILDNKVNEKKLNLYKEHINNCDDCLMLYVGIKSSINEMNERENIDVPEELYLETEKKIFPEKNISISTINTKNIFNSYLIGSLSAAASLFLIFYLGVMQQTDEISISEEKNIIEKQEQEPNFFANLNNENILQNTGNGITDGGLRGLSQSNPYSAADYDNITDNEIILPDFTNLNLEDITKLLNNLNIKYKIIKQNIDTIRIIHTSNLIFNTLLDSVTILIPNK